jgi:ubiquinone/menaquinone biosynthesis C-methylase UbiE
VVAHDAVSPRADYDGPMAAAYDRGRALSIDGLVAWRTALRLHVRDGDRVLDLGSGTGRWAEVLAQWFDVDIVGLEPAAGMRHEAKRKVTPPRVAYIGGDGQYIPLRTGSCDVAWVSNVIHHVDDLTACAHELRRALRSGAPVLIRSAFPGRLDGISLFRWFPGARVVAETFPSVETTLAAFATAGFSRHSLRALPQVSAPSLREACARVRLRADTTLAALSDDEFAAGLEQMEAAAAAATATEPIVDHLDLLVVR